MGYVNPGPSINQNPEPQASIGNIWKMGTFNLTLSPASVANATAAEQTFDASSIGLQTGDVVLVQKPTTQAGLGIVGSRVSATDVLAVTFMNATAATITPTASQVYKVTVIRVQPNFTAPTSGPALNW
jgi:hypothetical protein